MAIEAQNANEEMVLRFMELWAARDPALLVDHFTADALYHNVPIEPLRGHAQIRSFLETFMSRLEISIETTAIASRGELVFTERVDMIGPPGGEKVNLPIVGVMEVRDGLIAAWRDYYDRASIERVSGDAVARAAAVEA